MPKPRRAARSPRDWFLPITFVVVLLLIVGAGWVFRAELRAALGEDPRVATGELLPRWADTPTPVLPAATPATATASAAALKAQVDAVPRDGLTSVGIVVADATTGEVLVSEDAGPRTPASTLKVLSGLVALDVLGPDHTFRTRVTRDADGRLLLVGGGDPMLRSASTTQYPAGASLQELAGKTAAALKAEGTTSVSVGYDASLFGGPAWNPEWPEIFAWSVAPVSALTVDHARPDPTRWDRAEDPARLAADRFVDWLRRSGITVTQVAAAQAGADAVEVASVESLPVAALVERSLDYSDNDVAETLAWHTALARGQAATPGGAAAVLVAELQQRGLWQDGMHLVDGNGISSSNRVAPAVLARAIKTALDSPRLRAVVTGLPVAGVTGTLGERFASPAAAPGRGLVRAKTGTIRGAHALAGFVVTADGQPLVFAFMVNDAPSQEAARAWIDAAVSTLASCGCS